MHPLDKYIVRLWESFLISPQIWALAVVAALIGVWWLAEKIIDRRNRG